MVVERELTSLIGAHICGNCTFPRVMERLEQKIFSNRFMAEIKPRS